MPATASETALDCLTVSLAAMLIKGPTGIVTKNLMVSFAMSEVGCQFDSNGRCNHSHFSGALLARTTSKGHMKRDVRVSQVRDAHEVCLPAPLILSYG